MDESALEAVDQFCDSTRVLLELRTRSSVIGLACGMEHRNTESAGRSRRIESLKFRTAAIAAAAPVIAAMRQPPA